jgi:hypothetical protein
MCDCIEKLDDQLKPKGLRVSVMFSVTRTYPNMEAETIEGRKKRQPILPIYYPFCGVKYDP